MKRKKIIVSVTNDLITDQRVNKICHSLSKHFVEADILLVGRRLKHSSAVEKRAYSIERMNLFFSKGFLFYAEYTLRLFVFLLKNKADILVANDLDTLLPNYLVSQLKGSKLIYDSHEYFTEVPELKNRKIVRFLWKQIERSIFPKLDAVYTVNDSLAGIYSSLYGIDVQVIKNVPQLQQVEKNENKRLKMELGIQKDDKVIIYQGSVNVDRGLEELMEATKYLDEKIKIIIAGDGDILRKIKKRVNWLESKKNVIFLGRIPFEHLSIYTSMADIGVSLEKPSNLNYTYALPNKLFDYLASGLAVLSVPLPEIKEVMDQKNIGLMLENHSPQHIADQINSMFSNPSQLDVWKSNAKALSKAYCWELEEIKLFDVYTKFIRPT